MLPPLELEPGQEREGRQPPEFAEFAGRWIRLESIDAFCAGDSHPDAVTIVTLKSGLRERVAMPLSEFLSTLTNAYAWPLPTPET